MKADDVTQWQNAYLICERAKIIFSGVGSPLGNQNISKIPATQECDLWLPSPFAEICKR
jgi:hypothetical protein